MALLELLSVMTSSSTKVVADTDLRLCLRGRNVIAANIDVSLLVEDEEIFDLISGKVIDGDIESLLPSP